MAIVIEEFEDFAERQGCPHVIAERRWSDRADAEILLYLFESGAMSDGHRSHRDPPTDPLALLQARRAYVAALLKDEETAWTRHRDGLRAASERHRVSPISCPAPTARQMRQLTDGAARIEELYQRLADLDEEIEPLDTVALTRKRRREAMDETERDAHDQAERIAEEINRVAIAKPARTKRRRS